jgi:spore maturation protein CgeB
LLRRDDALRQELIANGLAAIQSRHSCAHRAAELIGVLTRLGAGVTAKNNERTIGVAS